MKAHEVLLAAADRIKVKGWNRGGYCAVSETMKASRPGDIGPTDVTGAIRLAGGGHWETANDDAIAEAKEAFRELIGGGQLGDWNDADGRTQEEVIAKLREAAAICKKKRFKPVHVFPWGPDGIGRKLTAE